MRRRRRASTRFLDDARGDRLRRPLARAGRAPHRPARRRSRSWHGRSAPGGARRSRRPRSRCARTSARRWSTRCVEEARAPRCRGSSRRPRESPGVDLLAYRDGDAGGRPRAGPRRAALPRPAATSRDPRGGAWTVTGDLDGPGGLAPSDGRLLQRRDYPDALRRVWAALTCPTSGDVLLVGRARATSSPTGAAPTTSAAAATARCTAPTRSGRWCSAASSRRPGRGRGAWSITDVAPMVRAHFGAREHRPGVARYPGAVPDALLEHAPPRPGAPRHAPEAQLVAARALHRGRRQRLRRQPGDVRRSCTGLGLDYRVAAVVAFLVAVTNNFCWNRHWTFDAPDGHAGLQAVALPRRQLGAFVVNLALLELLVGRRGAARRSARRRIAVAAATPLQLPRQQALDASAAECRPRGAARRGAGPARRRRRAAGPDRGRSDARVRRRRRAAARAPRPTPTPLSRPERLDTQPPDHRLTGQQAQAIAARDAEGPARRCASTATPSPRSSSRARRAGRSAGSRPAPATPARRSRRSTSTTPRARSPRRGPGRRSRGRWRAATRARSGARSTRRGCGSRCRCSSSLPFVDPRRPFRLLHLDLLVLVAFGGVGGVLQRREPRRLGPARRTRCWPTCWPACCGSACAARRGRTRRAAAAARARPCGWRSPSSSCVGFRIGLNVTSSNVIDVGYSGVIGADQLVDGQPALRRLPEGRRARRHLRAVRLRGLRAVRAGAAAGAAAGTTCPPPTPPRSRSTC